MFSTPLTCCSIGVATVSDTTFAFAPGQLAVTWMVGGAISGYCAMGSVESAMTPTKVMTMLMTPAKIGRSMKKCGKFMARLTKDDERGSLRSACLSGSGRFLGNRLHGHASLQQLQP